jgi:hypothetical protein
MAIKPARPVMRSRSQSSRPIHRIDPLPLGSRSPGRRGNRPAAPPRSSSLDVGASSFGAELGHYLRVGHGAIAPEVADAQPSKAFVWHHVSATPLKFISFRGTPDL